MSDPRTDRLIRELADPERFPEAASDVEVIQTHISVVFLTGDRAYKIKKPKDLGFLDFTTLERRRHYCHEEVRLNRRMAPHVYDGVVAVVEGDDGLRLSERPVSEGEDGEADRSQGEVVDWAVRMVRLPDALTLRRLLRAGEAGAAELLQVAERLAGFHESAERGARISEGAGWATVAGNDRENYEQLAPFAGHTLSPSVLARLEALTREELEHLRPLIDRRAREGIPCDTHGDLRLGHIYLLPRGSPGTSGNDADGAEDRDASEIVAIDCIEFNERFRWADPVSDLAFPVMELEFESRGDLAEPFAERYFEASGDGEGRQLLPYYTTYRDIVRGKVRSFESDDETVPEEIRARAARKATRHFLRALDRLSGAGERPGLVIVSGLPGVGKSTLARAIADRASLEWIDTDRVRKELFADPAPGGELQSRAGGPFEAGLYAPERTRRTYDECLARARASLFEGGRVVVEGTFRRDDDRRRFLELGEELGVRALLLECEVSPEEARERITQQAEGPSDADWTIHRKVAERWEESSPRVAEARYRVPLEGDPETGTARALAVLSEAGLMG